jgi:hypothetical protein
LTPPRRSRRQDRIEAAVYGVDEDAVRPAYQSYETDPRNTEPSDPRVSVRRRRQFLARVQETAAHIKARR